MFCHREARASSRENRRALALSAAVASGVACSAFGSAQTATEEAPTNDAGAADASADSTAPTPPFALFGTARTVASKQVGLGNIACDEGAVYFTTEDPASSVGSIVRLALGGSPEPLATDQLWPRALGINGSRAFWSSAQRGNGNTVIHSVATGGGNVADLYSDLSGNTAIPCLAVNGSQFAWLAPFRGRVYRGLDDGSPEVLVADAQSSLGRIAIRPPYVYWTAGGAIMRASTATSPPEEVLPPRAAVSDLAVDSEDVYFMSSDGSVGAVALNARGKVSRILTKDASISRGIALDGDRVYWIEATSPRTIVMRAKRGEEKPTVLAEAREPSALAVCPQGIFYTEPAAGVVMHIPRL